MELRPAFTYEGVLDRDNLPDYMDDLHGFHSFRMMFTLDQSGDARCAVIEQAHAWCKSNELNGERMSNQFLFADENEALAFRLAWC